MNKNKDGTPNKEEIKECLEWLRKNRSKVPHYDAFGCDNWAKIDAEIEVIAHHMDDEMEIDLRFQPDETCEEYDEQNDQEVYSSARFASAWLRGEEEESPAEGWKPLVKN